jgi:hypothetical protein
MVFFISLCDVRITQIAIRYNLTRKEAMDIKSLIEKIQKDLRYV